MLRREGEFPCHTFEISPDGALLFAPVKAQPGAEVILYLSALGRVPCVATRQTETGFEVAFKLTASKRARFVEQLKWFAAREQAGAPDRRRHDRIVPLNPITVVTLPWGAERVAKISSLSISGASIETEAWPAIGSSVVVGSRPAKVIRHFDDGFACEFDEQLRPEEFEETIRL